MAKKIKDLRYSKGWIALLATIIGLSFGGYTFLNRAVSTQVYVSNCGLIDYKPTILIKFCGNTGPAIGQIEWLSWGSQSATGTGVYEINDCSPTCIDGKYRYAEIEITLSKTKIIDGKKALTFIAIKTKDGKNLPMSSSQIDAWPLELAG